MHLFGLHNDNRIRVTGLCAALVVPLLVAAPSAAATATVAPARYSITDLGTLGTGNVSVANAINNAGVVVGYTDVTSGLPHGFRWSAGTMTDLGTEPGGDDSTANAINEAGQVAGTADRQSGGYGYPARWSATGALMDLGGPVTNELGVGNAIDPAGRVAGRPTPGQLRRQPDRGALQHRRHRHLPRQPA
jgi:probable HAF family extracellular repeat protein